MMKLLGSLGSPYVRKALIAAHVKGVAKNLEFVPTNSGPAADELRKKNPLQKIPILFLDDGTTVYDSHVICDYLDELAPSPKLFPQSGKARLEAMTLGALADGLMEAAILVAYESRFRSQEKWEQSWVDRQQAKVDAALAYLEANPPVMGTTPDYGHISLAVALGYLDGRQGTWRPKHPKLAAWQDKFIASVPAYKETLPKN